MTGDFDHVRDAFARSVIGRIVSILNAASDRAWRSSVVRRVLQSRHSPNAAQSIRSVALAVAVAMIVQPLLITAMPRTVAPGLAWWAYVSLALLCGLIAAQAEAIATAWPSSRLRRLIN